METKINLNKIPDFIFQNFAELNTQRIITIALPFLSLHSKTASYSSLVVGGYQVCTLLTNDSPQTTTGSKWSQAALLVSSTALGYLLPTYQIFLSSGVFFITHLYQLMIKDDDWQKRGMTLLQIAHQLIHLGSLYYGTPAWIMVSLLSQALSEFTQACQHAYAQDRKNRIPEAIASFLLALLRLHKAYSYRTLWNPKFAASHSKTSVLDLKSVETDKVSTTESDNILTTSQNPRTSYTDVNHDLSENFSEKIDARSFVLVDAQNQSYDCGSHFDQFGKSLVRNGNLCFKTITFNDESQGMELSFKMMPIYQERLQRIIEGIQGLTQEEQADFARLFQSEGLLFDSKVSYMLGDRQFREGSAYQLTFGGLGSLVVGKEDYYHLRDHVRITLNAGASLESFRHFLSIFGLEDVVQRSSAEDLERIKIGVLFRTFFPKQALCAVNDTPFYELPVEQLRKKITDEVPQMRQIFEQYPVEKTEIFPGYIRYGVPIDKQLSALGARALTTAVTGLDYTTEKDVLNRLANILKNGLLSQEFREMNRISEKGINREVHYQIGGSRSVYTQIITLEDIIQHKPLNSFYYQSRIRLLFSLSSLNRGSYQYSSDSGGRRHPTSYYASRPSLIEFIQNDPSKYQAHEIMVPDRIFPEEIKGMLVKTQELKDQIIPHFRECKLIQVDSKGKERINGILMDEFIRVEKFLSEKLVKHCHNADTSAVTLSRLQSSVAAGSGRRGLRS